MNNRIFTQYSLPVWHELWFDVTSLTFTLRIHKDACAALLANEHWKALVEDSRVENSFQSSFFQFTQGAFGFNACGARVGNSGDMWCFEIPLPKFNRKNMFENEFKTGVICKTLSHIFFFIDSFEPRFHCDRPQLFKLSLWSGSGPKSHNVQMQVSREVRHYHSQKIKELGEFEIKDSTNAMKKVSSLFYSKKQGESSSIAFVNNSGGMAICADRFAASDVTAEQTDLQYPFGYHMVGHNTDGAIQQLPILVGIGAIWRELSMKSIVIMENPEDVYQKVPGEIGCRKKGYIMYPAKHPTQSSYGIFVKHDNPEQADTVLFEEPGVPFTDLERTRGVMESMAKY